MIVWFILPMVFSLPSYLSRIPSLVTISKAIQSFLLVVQFVMASSVLYELIEWAIAIGLSPEEAENYNGQQGDMWDAHKDMLLATIGAIFYGLLALMLPSKTNNS